VLTGSLYDSGYDAFYAFRLGFESQGGEILATHVTTQPVQPADVAALLDSPEGRRADCVYAGYSGEQALDFVRAYSAAPAMRPPLLGSAFLVDEPFLRILGEEALGIRTVAPWATMLDTSANRDFRMNYRAQGGRDPDILAVLGFDTAQLIDRAASASHAHVVQAAGLAAGLATRGAIGPRGILSLDTNTGIVASPLYLREVRTTADGIAHVPIATLAGPCHDDAGIALLRASQKTGWLTPYLCG
jgi:branched-chain amino acid transport system substrate-binding protein